MTAVDLHHVFSSDVQPSAAGDLLTTDDPTQRILRRLLTNPGDYLWHPEYGAGLPARIGDVLDVEELTGLIREQMFLEPSVSHSPEPEIDLALIPNGVRAAIRYTRADGTPTALNFTVQQ